ncbi:hypothetical protein DOTSEDRAFT_72052 [Dothistroma septosporum NZE10]|uniref:Uncharacterized protein n=1 Tax=Dothistroma septosporum (strain NZE10 / CBS 128990) TaxID=675120 RepID=N1PLR5_DOTSN|nr:hypothetical protein DOTSEDRAFT_72052 [Dothistroma septosporum NZE10]
METVPQSCWNPAVGNSTSQNHFAKLVQQRRTPTRLAGCPWRIRQQHSGSNHPRRV